MISKKFIRNKYLTNESVLSTFGIGSMSLLAGNKLQKLYSNRRISGYENVGPSGCDSFPENNKKLKCKLYFLKKVYASEYAKLDREIQEFKTQAGYLKNLTDDENDKKKLKLKSNAYKFKKNELLSNYNQNVQLLKLKYA